MWRSVVFYLFFIKTGPNALRSSVKTMYKRGYPKSHELTGRIPSFFRNSDTFLNGKRMPSPMNRTIRSPGTSSFCAVYKSLGQCSLDGLPGQLSYRRIIPTRSAIGLSHRNDTLQNRRFPWHLRVNARGGTRSTNSPNAEIVVISDLCHILCLERVAIANREARHHGAAIYHRHLDCLLYTSRCV